MSNYTPVFTADDGAPFYFTCEAFRACSHGAAHSLGLRSKLRECVTLRIYYTHLTLKLADPQHLPGSPSELRGHRTQVMTPLALDSLKASGLVSAFVTRAAPPAPTRPQHHGPACTPSGHIPAVEIQLERADGPYAPRRPVLSLKRFSAGDDIWSRANDTLLLLSEDAPEDGGYLRVEYTVRYADGRVLQSCFPLTRGDGALGEPPDLGREVRRGAEIFAARRKPDHLSEEGYRDLLRVLGRGSRELSALLLDGYEIPDAEDAPPAVPVTLLHAGPHQAPPPFPA